MWGNVAVTQAFLTISEVLGHLDLLIADGRAAEDDSGDGDAVRGGRSVVTTRSEPHQGCRLQPIDMSDRRAHGGHSRAGALHGTSSAEPPRTDNSGLLLERVPAILYTADAGGDGRWHYVSPQIEEILGFTPEEWCADPGMWASRLHPDDAERVLDRRSRTSPTAAATLTSPIEYRLLPSRRPRGLGPRRRGPARGPRRGQALARRDVRHHRAEGRRGRAGAARRPAGGGRPAGRARAAGREPRRPHAGGGERRRRAAEPGDRRRGRARPLRGRGRLPRRARPPRRARQRQRPRPGWDRSRATPCSAAGRRS